jgi:hypothetical protein
MYREHTWIVLKRDLFSNALKFIVCFYTIYCKHHLLQVFTGLVTTLKTIFVSVRHQIDFANIL